MQSKWIGKSLTFWGVIITFLSTVVPMLGPLVGLDVSAEEVTKVGTDVTTIIQAFGGVTGTLLAIIGRMRASGPATLLK